jgi:hypothetical protein
MLLFMHTGKVLKLSIVILNTYHSYQLHTKFIPHSSLKINSIYWISSVSDFDITNQLLIRYSKFIKY